MKAKLYLKGMKEPKELEFFEGKAAEEMIKNRAVLSDAPFVIEGVVSCHKGDMRFVDWENSQPTYENEPIVVFNTQEATAFEEQISKFLVNGDLHMEGEMELLESKGFISLKKKKVQGMNKTMSDFKIGIIEKGIKDYRMFMKMLDAWKDWKGRKDFGEKKRVEALAKFADAM